MEFIANEKRFLGGKHIFAKLDIDNCIILQLFKKSIRYSVLIARLYTIISYWIKTKSM